MIQILQQNAIYAGILLTDMTKKQYDAYMRAYKAIFLDRENPYEDYDYDDIHEINTNEVLDK